MPEPEYSCSLALTSPEQCRLPAARAGSSLDLIIDLETAQTSLRDEGTDDVTHEHDEAAAEQTDVESAEETARRTIGFIEREMTSAEGAFFSALDADSEGDEGRYYVWAEKELREELGEDADLAHAYFDIFNRRLDWGRYWRKPYLGTSRCLVDYCGHFRPETRVCEEINLFVPGMLITTHAGPGMPYDPVFRNVQIERGVLKYAA